MKKSQISNLKSQINSKIQVPNAKKCLCFDIWCLKFIWSLILGIWCFTLYAQEQKPPIPIPPIPRPQAEEDKELTPEEMVKKLKEITELMYLSEDMLNNSSKGKELQGNEEIIKKIDELLKNEPKDNKPSGVQSDVMKKVEKLLRKTERSQTQSIDRINEIIKQAKEMEAKQKKEQKPEKDKKEQKQKPQNPEKDKGNQALEPYNPNRDDPAGKFKSKAGTADIWGNLPPKVRDQIMEGEREIEKFPPEYQDMLQEYFRRLAEQK